MGAMDYGCILLKSCQTGNTFPGWRKQKTKPFPCQCWDFWDGLTWLPGKVEVHQRLLYELLLWLPAHNLHRAPQLSSLSKRPGSTAARLTKYKYPWGRRVARCPSHNKPRSGWQTFTACAKCLRKKKKKNKRLVLRAPRSSLWERHQEGWETIYLQEGVKKSEQEHLGPSPHCLPVPFLPSAATMHMDEVLLRGQPSDWLNTVLTSSRPCLEWRH